ncbi:uncharacterized protein LOC8069577 isoform X3 [Sorghum bicolor]|uniref:uncharacterized protein LOC8069577 isoform X3 n=1 Tax=Sorghum bicolor TaxID=4558 RepID=UPI000B42365D|nr:uncharacterized protein LOC8069577 isoform X3 [Sorghum bicolor]|eukprot:XP_021311082.1 uncharacterized protein LOC8069577 isoform X3 [Sorghum bicolor]
MLCMKASSLLLTLIIPGYPGKDFHTFMQPVYDELNELFDTGMSTYDASQDERFQLYATVLHTVSDYLGTGLLARYSVLGQLGCVSCDDETGSRRLKHGLKQCFMQHRRFLPASHEFRYDASSFDGTEEHRSRPISYSGESLLEQIKSISDFDKSKTWKGVSGLYCLSYWKYNLLRHNLDFMHIEKNVCENIFGTLLEMDGKSKDNLQARKDLQEMNIRPDLHPQKKANGLKSHDCHILMQQLMPLALRGLLPDEVTSVLFDLCGYFRELNAKVLHINELEKLEERIIMTLCWMEMIFPPGFFTINVHLVLHLATEARIGGPVCYRSMYFVESLCRYLGVLKSTVRNKARPEGSIAESVLAKESMHFCSTFLDGFQTLSNRLSRNDENDESIGCSARHASTLFPHPGKPLGKPSSYVLRALAKLQAHRYVLFNCSYVDPYLRAHAEEIIKKGTRHRARHRDVEKIQNEKFHLWFRSHIMQLESENGIHGVKDDIRWLARGPVEAAKRYRAFNSRGFRFRPKRLDRVTQNSGVVLTAKTSSYASASDGKPVLGDVTY